MQIISGLTTRGLFGFRDLGWELRNVEISEKAIDQLDRICALWGDEYEQPGAAGNKQLRDIGFDLRQFRTAVLAVAQENRLLSCDGMLSSSSIRDDELIILYHSRFFGVEFREHRKKFGIWIGSRILEKSRK